MNQITNDTDTNTTSHSTPDASTWDVEHPGRWSRNGAPQPKLPRKYGPPRDEGAWARRCAEMQVERSAEAWR